MCSMMIINNIKCISNTDPLIYKSALKLGGSISLGAVAAPNILSHMFPLIIINKSEISTSWKIPFI